MGMKEGSPCDEPLVACGEAESLSGATTQNTISDVERARQRFEPLTAARACAYRLGAVKLSVYFS